MRIDLIIYGEGLPCIDLIMIQDLLMLPASSLAYLFYLFIFSSTGINDQIHSRIKVDGHCIMYSEVQFIPRNYYFHSDFSPLSI